MRGVGGNPGLVGKDWHKLGLLLRRGGFLRMQKFLSITPYAWRILQVLVLCLSVGFVGFVV